MRIAFWLSLLVAAAPAAKQTEDLEAALHDLRVVYAVAADIEDYRAAHQRLPELKNVEDFLRVVGSSHPKFGISDHRNKPLSVESDPVRNTYTVAAADEVIIRNGKMIGDTEARVNEMLRERGFDLPRALAGARDDNAAIHTQFAMWRLKEVIEEYFAAHHDYPDLDTLRKLAVEKATIKTEDPLVDGWGTPFRFRFTPQLKAYRIVAAGANKTFETGRWDEMNTTSDYNRDLVLFNGKFHGTWETHPDDDIIAERADDLEQVRAKFASLSSADPKELRASRVKGLMDEAHDAMMADDVVTAVAKYEEAVKLDSSFVDAGMLGFIASGLTNAGSPTPPPAPPGKKARPTVQNDAAMRDAAKRILPRLRAAAGVQPDDYNLTASLAGLQGELGDRAAARATIDRYAAAHPDDLRIHLLRIRVSQQPGDFDDAARALDAAAASPKNDAQALYAAGVLGYEMATHGDVPSAPRAAILRDARKLLDRAIALKPDSFEAMTYLNLVLRQQAAAEPDPRKQKALMEEAERVRSHAVEIIQRKKKG